MRRLLRARDGNIALTTALALPVVLALAGAAVDFTRYHASKTALQEFADTLALKGARELTLSSVSESNIESSVVSAARGGLASDLKIGAFDIAVVADRAESTVTVTLTQAAPRTLLLAEVAPYNETLRVEASAAARGGNNVCVVALQPDGDAINMTDFATVSARSCAILSNSTSSAALVARKQSLVEADLICSAGGYDGATANFSPKAPMTDCPAYADPLAARTPPPVGPCTYTNYRVGFLNVQPGQGVAPLITTRLSPGVYCGGLRIDDLAEVDFDPGAYVVKDGPLLVGKHSILAGDNVGFYFVGDLATFRFDKDAKIDLSAPKDGPMAGVLFFEDRAAPAGRNFEILSEDARRLIGTIYLSRANLVVDTQKPVADQSAYTAIVARRIEMKGKPTLVLNADYDMTDVPVPSGLGPVGAEVYLRE